MLFGWLIALSMISLVLLWNAETNSFQYWVRVGVTAVSWCIFFLCFTPLRAYSEIKIVTAKADLAIILLIVIFFFLFTTGAFINALIHRNIGTSLLFGLAGLGIFNVIKDLTAKIAREHNAAKK